MYFNSKFNVLLLFRDHVLAKRSAPLLEMGINHREEYPAPWLRQHISIYHSIVTVVLLAWQRLSYIIHIEAISLSKSELTCFEGF